MIQVNMKAPFILAYEFGKIFVSQKKKAALFLHLQLVHLMLIHIYRIMLLQKAYFLSLAESMNYEFKDKKR
jgi:hypothetical protein